MKRAWRLRLRLHSVQTCTINYMIWIFHVEYCNRETRAQHYSCLTRRLLTELEDGDAAASHLHASETSPILHTGV